MIIKSFEINKVNLDFNNLFLFYGKNNGYKNEFTKNIIKNKYSVINYDEKEILENKDNFIENLLTKSLFDEQKIMDILQTDLVPSSLLCIGYPKQTKFPKPRRNLKDLVNVVW